MKALTIFLLAISFALGTQAQIYEENVAHISGNIKKFEKELSEVRTRIYYLEATLDKEISEDSIRVTNGKRAKKLDQLKGQRMFRDEELKILYQRNDTLQKSIAYFIAGENRLIKEGLESKIPVRMSRCEYKQRTRALMYKVSEEGLTNLPQAGLFDGLLINYKTGRNEIAKFVITNSDCPELPPVIKVLNPQERLYVSLPIGNYTSTVTCGNFYGVNQFSVSPLEIKHLDGEDIYWGAYKALSDQ